LVCQTSECFWKAGDSFLKLNMPAQQVVASGAYIQAKKGISLGKLGKNLRSVKPSLD
jgi:hypothetical protein